MAFQVSPGINVSEIDLTTVIPAVSTTTGGIAGIFRWGPIGQLVLVDSEASLVRRFGEPNSSNFETFFTAANFLAYGNSLLVSRAAGTGTTANDAYSAVADSTGTVATAVAASTYSGANVQNGFFISNEDDYNNSSANGNFAANTTFKYVARYPGSLGSSLSVSQCDSATQYSSNLVAVANTTFTINSNTATFVFTDSAANLQSATVTANLASTIAWNALTVGDYITVGNSTIGTQNLQVSSKGSIPVFFSNVGTMSTNTTLTALTNTATITVGMFVSANIAGMPSGVTVASIVNSTAVTLSAATTATGSANLHFADETLEISFYSPYTLSSTFTPATTNVARLWEHYGSAPAAPGQSTYVSTYGNTSANDELHVVVTDALGQITGTPGQVLEVFTGLSRATDAKTSDGSTNYYVDVINKSSQYVWYTNHRQSSGYVANAALIASQSNTTPMTIQFAGGQDGAAETAPVIGALTTAYDLFKSTETSAVSLLLTGKSDDTNTTQLANYVIQNVAQPRMDCVVFVSPNKSTVVNNAGNEATSIVSFRNGLTNSSYAVLDSGYKYQYDKYSDIYRYVPLNGDIAGLCAYTDNAKDPWYSPAGFNRGQIKNLVKLAFNPSKAQRDLLYPNAVNPVVTFPGQGTVLFGDKTLQAKSSAFDRINVRRLFIVLEKAISAAAQYSLFEFNDAFTRSQFVSLVTPFLQDVQGRQGIYDFRVVCDDSNNTAQVIDANQFVGDIYVKPARSVNFIQLNFVAVRTGVEFSEIVGKF